MLGTITITTITRMTNNPHLNFVKGTVLGDKEQWVGIREKEKGKREKEMGIRDKG